MTSVVDGVSKTEKQDASGNIISVTDPAGTTAYNYRPDGQMNSVIAPGQITTTFGYDDFGRRITMNDPSFGLIEYGYDAMGMEFWKLMPMEILRRKLMIIFIV